MKKGTVRYGIILLVTGILCFAIGYTIGLGRNQNPPSNKTQCMGVSLPLYNVASTMCSNVTGRVWRIRPAGGRKGALVDGLKVKRITAVSQRAMVLFDGCGMLVGSTNTLPVSARMSFGLSCGGGRIVANDVRLERLRVYTKDGESVVGAYEEDAAVQAEAVRRLSAYETDIPDGDVRITFDNNVIIERFE